LSDDPALLRVEDLAVQFESGNSVVRAVDGVSWSVRAGQTVAIVGESGSGKSVSALSVLRLLPEPPARITAGRIHFEGHDLLSQGEADLRRIRGRRIAMVFQEPMTSLNPVYTIGDQVAETMQLHQGMTRRDAWRSAVAMLEKVGIPDAARRVGDYPHELSGGMQQRVMIAMALACEPRVLIADEPTTALDVTIQAQILTLLRDLQSSTGVGIVLITHDFGVVAAMADYVHVMREGRIVEHGEPSQVFEQPRHEYTRALLQAVPRLDEAGERVA
jgi:ABC-type dipeptide/oligopeptide/nickel transport system ATPase component